MAQKNTAIRTWLETLPRAEREIADAALRLHQNFVVPKRLFGACYLLAFFLHQYARRELRVEAAQAVVGYAGDQTGPVRMSHAWLEMGGRRTDISLTRTEFPQWQLTGDLLIHDQSVSRGTAQYTYHRDQSTESLEQVARSKAANPIIEKILVAKEREHLEMADRVADDMAMWEWLQGAPPNVGYSALVAAARGEPFRWPD
jgi:hypothetical protein